MKRSILVLLCVWGIAGCSSNGYKPQSSSLGFDVTNACSIFDENRSWQKILKKNQKKWGVPTHVVLAIIRQESSFRPHARPYRNGKLLSSAYGYPQALDGVWGDYKRQTRNRSAKRSDFKDAVDFIGWYTNKTNKINKLSKWDAKHQYLAYHEGWHGYLNRSYQKKGWLVDVSDKVKRNASSYYSQIKHCG